MKKAGLLILAVGLSLIQVVFLVAQVRAAEQAPIPTSETHFLATPKLLVSAYGWEYTPTHKNADGVVIPEQRWLSYIQLYNNTAVPVDLGQWSLKVEPLDSEGVPSCGSAAGCPEIVLPSAQSAGYIAPRQHSVLATEGSVAGAAVVFQDIQLPVYQKSTTPWFRLALYNTGGGYHVSEVVGKLDTRTDPVNEYAYWQRNFSSTGQGYLESFSATSEPPDTLFNDPPYTIPDTPSISVVEISAYAKDDCGPTQDVPECHDYVKLHITGDYTALKNYTLRTDSGSSARTTGNTFWLGGLTPTTDGYITVTRTDASDWISLTNSGGHVWLEDTFGMQRYDETLVAYPAFGSAEQGFSRAFSDTGWTWTTTPRPNAPNLITPVPPEPTTVCAAGKYLNPDTGRCRTVEEAINTLAACSEGEYRNPETNRCRKIAASSATILVPCGEGQERNPLTNRCRNISSALAELLPCDEGYERNPTTNRCRKVLSATTPVAQASSATHGKQAEGAGNSLLGWVAVGTAAVGALGYAVYEWRKEIGAAWRRVGAKMGRGTG